MDDYRNTCPLSQTQLLDDSFMDHRAQLLALAAFLDRFERSALRNAETDFRMEAFKEALQLLVEPGPERARRVQLVMSDHNSALLDVRDGQSAYGASVHPAQMSPHDDQGAAQ
ncbi:hypothetical protein [Deinococcus sp. QL22]|uniref:hypothetical protein n=1 Tax=Deinococcus sp. QL22 TaxID=2939437 RepID=UPI00201760C6|nr:hypothetical protein [Deinococcus sp. QL22]UQN08645.1 hypothetical protein M1R55_21190 [Deinococcus sp. QL22]